MIDIQVFSVFVLFENGQTTAPKMEVEICQRTGTMRGRGSNVSIGQQTGWNVIHDGRSSAFNVFVLDSKMAKQQLQKWELKFVTELEPLEGASPVQRQKL